MVPPPPDLTAYRDLHQRLRRAAVDPACFDRFAACLRRHMAFEDDVVASMLAERVPTYASCGGTIAADHRRLADLLDDGDVDALAGLLGEHLDLEDGEVLPLFARHFTAEEYEPIAAHVAAVAAALGATGS